MFFFPHHGISSFATADKSFRLRESACLEWEVFYSSEVEAQPHFDLKELFYVEVKPPVKVEFIAPFAFLTDFFLTCLLIALARTQETLKFLRNSREDLIKKYQKQVFTQFIEQARIKDKVKGIFIPLKFLLNSLPPIKAAA